MLVAKNDFAHVHLAAQIKEHSLNRIYQTIVYGVNMPDEGDVDAPIGRSTKDRKKMAVIEGGRSAQTHYSVIKRYSGYTHVQCKLKTGRTHQIRVHMAYIGHPVAGDAVYFDIGKMPHLLIAGTTGSGKSVCMNSIIISLLYKASPDDVKLIMVDPKMVELVNYNNIPHLLIPVVTDPRKAAGALAWAVQEMDDRYNKFASKGVRDLKGYNKAIEKENEKANFEYCACFEYGNDADFCHCC